MNNKLFTPYKLGPITLRNRIIRSAAFENMCTGNVPSQMLHDYHVSVAHGVRQAVWQRFWQQLPPFGSQIARFGVWHTICT